MKKNIFIIFIILICMILSVNAESNKDPFYRIKDKIIGDNNFTIETNHRTSGYCRGGKLLLNKKNIFESKSNCVLSIEKYNKENIIVNLVFGDGGGSGEGVYIKTLYNLNNHTFSFLDNKNFYYYSGGNSEKYSFVLSEIQNRSEKQIEFINFQLIKFIKNNKIQTSYLPIYLIDCTDEVSDYTLNKIKILVKKYNLQSYEKMIKFIPLLNEKILEIEKKNIKSGKKEKYIGILQSLYIEILK